MSSKIPTITQDFLRDRGFQTDIVICPNCFVKWEVLRSERADALRCVTCNCPRPPVDYQIYTKTLAIAELDLMPSWLLLAAIRQLKNLQRERGQHSIADFLEARILALSYALEGNKNGEV